MEQMTCFETENRTERRGQSGCGKCAVCGRRLTDPQSVLRGMGPVCAGKNGAVGKSKDKENDRPHDVYLAIPITDGIVIKREDGKVYTNVPHTVVCHSPDGYEFGYGGSGPADLALNIVEAVLSRIGYGGQRISLRSGDECWDAAWTLHQPFKDAFIATAPHEGCTIKYERVEQWIRQKMEEIKRNAPYAASPLSCETATISAGPVLKTSTGRPI